MASVQWQQTHSCDSKSGKWRVLCCWSHMDIIPKLMDRIGGIWWLLGSCLFQEARKMPIAVWKSSTLRCGWSCVSDKIWSLTMGCDRDQCNYYFVEYGVWFWRSHNIQLVRWVSLLVSSDHQKHCKHVAKLHVRSYKHRRCRNCHRVIASVLAC